MTNLKATLARDIDDVLAWVYGEVHSDTAALAGELAAVFCDKSESVTVRMNAAGAFQVFAPDTHGLPESLLSQMKTVYRDSTEPLAIRSAANSLCASLLAYKEKSDGGEESE